MVKTGTTPVYLLVELDLAIEVVLGDSLEIVQFLLVVRFHLCHGGVQDCFATRYGFISVLHLCQVK